MSGLTRGMLTSVRNDWETPDDLFAWINDRYGFDLDVCATAENAKCERYFTPEQDGLQQQWLGTCWMNPPYGSAIAAWVKKAYEAAMSGGADVVCLLPARTDTAWWHEYVSKATQIDFIRGRVVFKGAKHNAPFPCAVVHFSASAMRAGEPCEVYYVDAPRGLGGRQ